MDSSNSNRQGSSRRGHRVISSYKKDSIPAPDPDPALDAFKKKKKHNIDDLYAQPTHINTLDGNTQPISNTLSPNPNKYSYGENSSSGEKGDLSKTNKLQLQRDKLKRERQKRDNKATDSQQNYTQDEELIDMNKSLYNLEFFNRTNKSRIHGMAQKGDNGYADDIDAILNRGNDMRAGRADPSNAFNIINDTAALKRKNNWDYDIEEIGGYDPKPSVGGNFKKKGFGGGDGMGLSQELKMLGIKNDAQKNAMFGAPGGPPGAELRAKDKGASLGDQAGPGVVDFGYKNFDDIVVRNSKFSMPKNPYGKKLSFRIFSTWGEKFYVGLCGIEVFNADGIPLKIPGSCISATPRDLTILPDYSDDPRKLEN